MDDKASKAELERLTLEEIKRTAMTVKRFYIEAKKRMFRYTLAMCLSIAIMTFFVYNGFFFLFLYAINELVGFDNFLNRLIVRDFSTPFRPSHYNIFISSQQSWFTIVAAIMLTVVIARRVEKYARLLVLNAKLSEQVLEKKVYPNTEEMFNAHVKEFGYLRRYL